MRLENYLAKLFTVSPSALVQADMSLVYDRPVSPAHRRWWAEHGEAQVPSDRGQEGGLTGWATVPGIITVL